MRSLIAAAALVTISAGAASAQPAPQISIALEARSEGLATGDRTAAALAADVRKGLDALGDVTLVADPLARRMVWLVVGTTPGVYSASMMVTERYDRETLMVLGIEDDQTAERMMSLQIVNDHQIFTGGDLADLSRRIVDALNGGVLARLRRRRP